ncbi:MAG TPA: hypothetical protein VH877_11410 [Polyangia bacterium]|jgi:hypothetical protein|nr:hypothetical protein [Polyangia bacterium]
MANARTFDSKVAARTRTAREILNSPELLAVYERRGGKRADLEKIVEQGQIAERLYQTRSEAQAAGGTATTTVVTEFTALQNENTRVMAAVRATVNDLREAGASAEVVQALDKILTNETRVVLRPTEDQGKSEGGDEGKSEGEGGEESPGETQKPRRRAVRSQSQEAIRAEIQKDVGALLQLTAAHPALAERQVSKARLETLYANAQGLSGRLATRVVRKAEVLGTTKAMRAAATAQRRTWSASYGLLTLAAQDDVRIRQLLADASRKS